MSECADTVVRCISSEEYPCLAEKVFRAAAKVGIGVSPLPDLKIVQWLAEPSRLR